MLSRSDHIWTFSRHIYVLLVFYFEFSPLQLWVCSFRWSKWFWMNANMNSSWRWPVLSFMFVKAAWWNRSIIAFITFKWLLSCMPSSMYCQITKFGTCIITFVTLVAYKACGITEISGWSKVEMRPWEFWPIFGIRFFALNRWNWLCWFLCYFCFL